MSKMNFAYSTASKKINVQLHEQYILFHILTLLVTRNILKKYILKKDRLITIEAGQYPYQFY